MRKIDELTKSVGVDYPEDITRMKEIIPELRNFPDSYVQRFYREYSDDIYCAGWMYADDDQICLFAKWLGCDYEVAKDPWDELSDEERQRDQEFIIFLKSKGFKK